MDPLAVLNSKVAETLGWKQNGLSWERKDSSGFLETLQHIPSYTENFIAMWQMIDYAAKKSTEYSLFMMIYDAHPLWMASFIRGMDQRTSTGECPRIATCKAFLMMFYGGEDPSSMNSY